MSGGTPKLVAIELRPPGHKAGLCVVKLGEVVTWPPGLKVWFPRGGIFEPDTQHPDVGGAQVARDLSDDLFDTPIEYCIYDKEQHVFVEGNSHPALIIKRP